MSPLALHFLRRVSGVVVLVAAFLILWTQGAARLGLDVSARMQAAEAALRVARDYGADAHLPALAEGEKQLAAAREHLQRGDRPRARAAAVRAVDQANEAQRVVILEKEALRLRSAEVVEAIDRDLQQIETLYGDTVRSVGRERASALLSRMKATRATGAALFLAHEEGDHRRVVREQGATMEFLAETRRQFEAAGRP